MYSWKNVFEKTKSNSIRRGRYEYYQIFEQFGYFLKDTASQNYVEGKPF